MDKKHKLGSDPLQWIRDREKTGRIRESKQSIYENRGG